MLKKGVVAVVVAVMVLAAVPVMADKNLKAGINVGDEGLEGFYLAVGEHNKIPRPDVEVVRNDGISDEELPVVYFIAAKAKVSPAVIVKYRIKYKWSWIKIAKKYGIGPDAFYVEAGNNVQGKVYKSAYQNYRKYPKKKWSRVKLSDADVVNLVNLRFLCDRYGKTPAEIMSMRDKGESFVSINKKIRVVKGKDGKVKKVKVKTKKKVIKKKKHDKYDN